MAQPYVGEIRMFGGNFAPVGWHFCDGSSLAISENEVLFNLIGTTYGGDGQETFNVPDLRGRIPIHQGNGFAMGETGGAESVTLTVTQIPVHSHAMLASTNVASAAQPTNNVIGKSAQIDTFINAVPGDPLSSNAITPVGGSQPHDNTQPFLCVSFIISLYGIYPPAS